MHSNKSYLAVSMLAAVCIAAAFAQGNNSRYAFSLDNEAVNSPADHISSENIHMFSDRLEIDKEDLIWAEVKDTHSMEPVLNKNSISLEKRPSGSSEIKAGDIISYEQGDKVIIHRVVFIGEDSDGWLAITKGDNNEDIDPYKVRFSSVKGIVVGVLY